jgi:superfamily II DNA or RNA helicase
VIVPKNVGNMTFANLLARPASARPLNKNVRAKIAANLAENKKRRNNAAIAAHRFNVGIVDIPEKVLEDKQPRKEMTDLKDHQRAVAEAIVNQSGIIAVHSVGSGKTRTAIFAAETLLRQGIITHVLVVSPLTLLDTFKAEMRKHGLKSLYKYYYFGQEDFVKQIEHGAKLHIESALVIFDEIHTLKGTDTQKFKVFKEYTKRAKRVIGLTATPIVYSYTDLFGPLQLVTQSSIGHPSESEVKSKYSKYFSFFERIADNNPDYPSYTIHEVDVSAKTSWIVSEIARNPTKRFIIYGHLIEKGLDVLGRELEAAGITINKITGETKVADRTKAQEKYNSGEVKVLLISKAAAYGIDLKKTRGLIVYEKVDNPSALVQIVGRAVRFESHKGLPKPEQHVDVFLLEDPDDREYYMRKIWLKMDEINRFYRSMWPSSIGVKLVRRNFNRKQIMLNRINRGNNIINVMRNMNLPKNFVNRSSRLSNAHKVALRPMIRKMITNNMS